MLRIHWCSSLCEMWVCEAAGWLNQNSTLLYKSAKFLRCPDYRKIPTMNAQKSSILLCFSPFGSELTLHVFHFIYHYFIHISDLINTTRLIFSEFLEFYSILHIFVHFSQMPPWWLAKKCNASLVLVPLKNNHFCVELHLK